MIERWLVVAREVREALAAGRPVVALESTLISHGLPHPANLEVARASEQAVRDAGAVPATVAIRDGRLLVGLAAAELEALATAPEGSVMKAARPTLSRAVARVGWAATTVSATMIAAHAAGIRVFATGGIGGVHRGALAPATDQGATFDISSDLEELARTPMVVVCAGPKAILDVPATLEYLETRGVPVVTIGQEELPGFYARSSGLRSPLSGRDVEEAACDRRGVQLSLGLSGILVVRARARATWRSLGTSPATPSIEPSARRATAGIAGPATDAVAARPDRRDHRRRIGPRQTRA